MAADGSASAPLGQSDEAVRILNFAGGGFDTVMQLGVVHALLVTQGRPPDAVVGISAGAIQAAACAEVFQAGGDVGTPPALDLPCSTNRKDVMLREFCERYQGCQEARVQKLRDFVHAAEVAPAELLDSAFPDAYEIESRDPLQPLRTPRFAGKERDERERMLQSRSGMAKLYNDLLRVDIPLGVLTRAVRRWLGFQAAGDIANPWIRRAVKALEVFRIWLLIGTQLYRMGAVAKLLLRPLFLSRARAKLATAGGLIFRLDAMRRALSFVGSMVCIVVLAAAWVTISASPAALSYLFIDGSLDKTWEAALFLLLVYSVPLVMVILQVATKHDAVSRGYAFVDGLKGVFQFALLMLFWSIVVYTLWSPVDALWPNLGLGIQSLPRELAAAGASVEALKAFVEPLSSRLPFLVGTVFVVGIAFFAWVRFKRDSPPLPTKDPERPGFLRWYGGRFLLAYNLSRSLLHHYGLERFLSRTFDCEDYYGPLDTDRAIEQSLRPVSSAPAKDRDPALCIKSHSKTVGEYASTRQSPPIAVGLGAADLADGHICIMPDDMPLICGLRAATAVVPLLPSVEYRQHTYVDALNVTSVPTPAMLKLLRSRGVADGVTGIHAYRVAPVPFSKSHFVWKDVSIPNSNLVDIALRALKLQQYRDADMERRLTERYSEMLAPGCAQVSLKIPAPDVEGGDEHATIDKKFFKIDVIPVELDIPSGLNGRILFGDREQRRAEVLRTIAQGCRAMMQVVLHEAMRFVANGVEGARVPCAKALYRHIHGQSCDGVRQMLGSALPGSEWNPKTPESVAGCIAPPGLPEVCQHCRLDDTDGAVTQQVLVFAEAAESSPVWPHEFQDRFAHRPKKRACTTGVASPEPPLSAANKPIPYRNVSAKSYCTSSGRPLSDPAKIESALKQYWPKKAPVPKDGTTPDTADEPLRRPTVSLLFSGGVFRGVFQIGVVNALHELKIKPDIVAGASVGSITAAIAADILSRRVDAKSDKDGVGDTSVKLARLAATYLAVDRIILTDRFADFVREFTIRAAATNFSLNTADRLFRKYDMPNPLAFDKGAREVVAGIERLLYVNFYQLNRLVRAMRNRRSKSAFRQSRQLLKQWLDRMHVGEELLGAEPLRMLIEHFIESSKGSGHLRNIDHQKLLKGSFQQLLANGVVFLATTTDLGGGRLVTLGDPFEDYGEDSPLDLTEALLASSAFPAIFRPRSSMDLFPVGRRIEQFIDGGVMDNFPIDAVVNLLERVSDEDSTKGLVQRHPLANDRDHVVPHLVFAASLEPSFDVIDSPARMRNVRRSWPALRKRVKQLSYNYKLDMYHSATRELRALSRSQEKPSGRPAMDLEIAALKPKWLCGTMAFHPMLGYRRTRQAESIAHGCALTLLRMRGYDDEALAAWGVDLEALPKVHTLADGRDRAKRQVVKKPGYCWLRDRPCPFSQVELKKLNGDNTACGSKIDSNTILEVSRIYEACCQPRTHGIDEN